MDEVNEAVTEAVNEEYFSFYDAGEGDDLKTYKDEGLNCYDTQGYSE